MADIMKKLAFTRDWRVNGTEDEGGFLTHESREEVVRADMQCLHEETKNHINEKLWPAIQAVSDKQEASFGHIPTIGENGNWMLWNEEEQKYKDSGTSAWQGDMSTALEKVAQDAAAAVTPDGLGVYTKEETLSDETKEAFGLDAGATPNAAFAVIPAMLAGHSAVETGTYVGDGEDKEVVTFDRTPKVAVLVELFGERLYPWFLFPGVGFQVEVYGWISNSSVLPYLAETGIHTMAATDSTGTRRFYGNEPDRSYFYAAIF